jgi:glycosyltransferase involved in cell wall biosynthesis
MASILRQLTIAVHSSLIYETFCLANIEAMSMEVALVTFAIAGVGEYVREPSTTINEDPECENSCSGLGFRVGPNAVVVDEATPQAIARAVLHLIEKPEVRKEIASEGAETVRNYFVAARQMSQYRDLYAFFYEREATAMAISAT